ncbi:Ku protein [Rhodopila sp.]|uniref:non-homologous end joining protein Ku n=1 Tax=Rhodopila sp. TaxID=2480087 RepID=UPI003D0B5FDC
MAQRPIWRGQLRLALVSCPVALYNAKHDRAAIRFHLINPDTGNRIQMVTQDSETEKPLSRRDLVKGYEFKKNTYLLLNDDDFNSVKVDSSDTMTVEKFVEAESIDAIYYDASYYVVPDGQTGRDVYAVLLEAIEKTGRVALSRLVIGQRERTVALRPMQGGLVAHTLFEQRDINDAKTMFDDAAATKTDPEMVKLATQLIDRQTGRYDPADLEDRYETRLREMIDAKLKGEGIEDEATPEPAETNVIDLMAALKRSLGDDAAAAKAAAKPAAKTTAKAKPEKPAAAPQRPSRKRAS